MGLICRSCGKKFTNHDDLCMDDICRDCHTEEFTFEDCYLHHLSFSVIHWLSKGKPGNYEIIDQCPRCNRETIKLICIPPVYNGMLVKCENCDFYEWWGWYDKR
jgi:hypothetical protein